MAWLHRLLARIFGWTPKADATTAAGCAHPTTRRGPCTYYARKGIKWGWWQTCNACGSVMSCSP